MGLFLQLVFFLCCFAFTEAFLFNRKVNCQVTSWSSWSDPNDDGQRIRTCKILRLPANGGRKCPHLQEVKDEGCNCTVWSGWSVPFGFGQKSRTRQWIESQSFRTNYRKVSCSKVLEEDIRYTGIKPTMRQTARLLLRTIGLGQEEASYTRPEYPTLPGDQIGKVRDIVLILDSSGSIGRANFDKAKRDASTLFGLMCPKDAPFDVNKDKPFQNHQLAMLTFSSSVEKVFDFNRYDKTLDVLNAIKKARYIGMSTNTEEAFRKAKEMFQTGRGARKSENRVKREVLILTDGLSTRGGDAVKAAKDLSKVADVYGLMIGKFSADGQAELTEYVSKPRSQHLFNVENYDRLSKLVDYLRELKEKKPDWCQSFD